MAPFIRVFPLSPLGLARSGEVLSDRRPPYAFSITYGCSVSSVGADGNMPLRMGTQEVLGGWEYQPFPSLLQLDQRTWAQLPYLRSPDGDTLVYT